MNPTIFFAQGLKDALVGRGISVAGEPTDIDDVAAELAVQAGATRRTLVESQSPPLREIAAILMKVSQNQYAETFLKALGASQRRSARPMTGARQRSKRSPRGAFPTTAT